MRKKILLLLLVAGFVVLVAGEEVTESGLDGRIDWTRMQAAAEGTATLDKDALDYPLQLQHAYQAAREDARQRLYRTLLAVRIDSRRDLRQLLADTPEMRHRLQNFIFKQAYEHIPPYRNGNRVLTVSKINLTGRGSLYELFPEIYPFFRVPPPTAFSYKGGYHYTGLVIDARHLPLKLSAGLSLYNDKGTLLYNPAFTDRRRFTERGHLQFLPRLDHPGLKKRAGGRFLYIHAARLAENAPTDLVLHSRDADLILASPTLPRELKNCRVVVLAAPPAKL
jgi:hypothetical protein